MDRNLLIETLSGVKKSATFMTISGYSNANGEIANYSIVFNISYENALKRSIAIMESYNAKSDLQKIAKTQILKSFNKSLSNLESVGDGYDKVVSKGKLVKGIKFHRSSAAYHIYGFVVHKKVLLPATYKDVNSSDLTIEKRKLMKLCPVSKYRQFKLSNSFEKIAIDGKVILSK
jgi:hypothetical protein